MSGKRDNTSKLDALLASVTDDMLDGNVMEQFQDYELRVERILLELVRPDPAQPRRVLPARLHFAFHNNQMTPTQALRELVQATQTQLDSAVVPLMDCSTYYPTASTKLMIRRK